MDAMNVAYRPNLNPVALPVREIIAGTYLLKNLGQSLDTPTLPFLKNF